MAVLPERAVGAAREVDPSDAAVGIVANIDDIVVARPQVAKQRGARGEAVVVDVELVAFAIHVVRDGDLAGQRGDQEILPIDVGDEQEIVARALQDRVEARVGVLLEPPEGREVVLEAVAVAVAEEPDAELLVVEQEAAKVGLKRLDAHAHRIEIVAIRYVADVVVDKGFLHPHEVIEPVARRARLDQQDAALGHVHVVGVEGQREPVFDFGRLERGRALGQRGADEEGLRKDVARVLAEYVEAVGAFGRLHADGDGEGPRLDHRVADQTAREEPVVAGDERPLVCLQRTVALECVLMIRVEPPLLDQAERLYQPPAVRNGDLVSRERLGGRSAHRSGVVLPGGFGKLALVSGASASFDGLVVDGGRALVLVRNDGRFGVLVGGGRHGAVGLLSGRRTSLHGERQRRQNGQRCSHSRRTPPRLTQKCLKSPPKAIANLRISQTARE